MRIFGNRLTPEKRLHENYEQGYGAGGEEHRDDGWVLDEFRIGAFFFFFDFFAQSQEGAEARAFGSVAVLVDGVLVTGNQNTGQTQKTKSFCGQHYSPQNAFCPMVT